MDPDTRKRANEILTRLCVGRSICGVHFYADQPILVLASYDGSSAADFDGPAEAYLMLEAGWQVPDDLSVALAAADLALPTRPLEDLVAVACGLRRHPIVSALLGDRVPHLGLRFADGSAFVANAWDATYEVWSIGAGEWSVYALAGGEITWASDHPALK